MAINQHHTIEEIAGQRCSVIEKGISPERAAFIKEILECSHQQVVQEISVEGKATVGVIDLTFSLTNALYSRVLYNKSGEIVSPSYWYRQQVNEGFYWEY